MKRKDYELLDYRHKLIKNSLRKILEELDDMQKSVPVDREKQYCRDIYHRWLFEGKEEEWNSINEVNTTISSHV